MPSLLKVLDEVSYKACAKLLPASGLGRRLPQIGESQELLQDVVAYFAASGEVAIMVIRPAEEFFGERVDDHVARSGVEGDDLIRAGTGRDGGEVSNSAEVEQDASLARMAEEKIVEQRNQRRSLTAGGEIGRAKIGNDGNRGASGDDRGFAGLPGCGNPAAEKW